MLNFDIWGFINTLKYVDCFGKSYHKISFEDKYGKNIGFCMPMPRYFKINTNLNSKSNICVRKVNKSLET